MEDNDPRLRILGRRDGKAREDTEAGPSVACKELVIDKPSVGRAEQKHSIFLSHSGAQKAFVRRLRNALVRNAYLPFFDEDPDSLPKGEAFVEHMKDAARLADVAIVVLSDDFFNSKWPMIELAIFTEEQRRRKSVLECKKFKILPLFMGLSVEEFRNEGSRLGWLKKWYELKATDNRIDPIKWQEALGVLGGVNGIQYKDFKNEEEYINSILFAIFKLVAPDLKWEDKDVKGKLKLHQAVAEMFAKAPPKTRVLNVRTIGLYGVGGIGKTTICKSSCNKYFAEFNGKVWHAELGKKGIEEIQKDVLRHLVGASESLLNQTVKCKDQWRSLLRRKIEHKVFLAIDNVWNEDVSREQAECLLEMGFHPDSLVIVTSRNRELLKWLGIHEECCFEMPELDKEDATAVLLQSAAPGHDIQSLTDCQRVAISNVVERCLLAKGPISDIGSDKHYVPLALKVLGRQVRLPLCGNLAKLTEWVNKLDLKRADQKQHPIFSVLRLGYDNLSSPKDKSIFLDVALCAPRQHDNTSASVERVCKWLSMVYDVDVDNILDVLEDLQKNGLCERWEDPASPFGMHELYSEFAKAEAAGEENSDTQLYLYHEDGLDVPAIMQMDPLRNCWPLKRVHVYNGGFSKLTIDELRFMVRVEVLKLDFCFELESLDLRCLKSLRSLEIRGCFELRVVEGLKDLKRLKFFRWNTCRVPGVALDLSQALETVEIYGAKGSKGPIIGSFEACDGLQELTLSRLRLLTAVPDLNNFPMLEKVDFGGCCRIEEVRGLEGLRRLKHLNLQNCKRLHHCYGLEGLRRLKHLNLQNCKRLRDCYGLEKLVTIETLNLERCGILQLPEVWDLTGLSNLRCLYLAGSLVRELVLNGPQLNQLAVIGGAILRTVVLLTDSWKSLNRFNEDMAGTTQAWSFECRNVIDRNSFEGHHTINFSNCHTLESLGDIRSLRSLRYRYLQKCMMPTTLIDLNSSPFLEVVDLSYCEKLEDSNDIGSMRSLRLLTLQNCEMLTTLPNLRNLPLLAMVDLSYCYKLEDLGDIGPLPALQYLYLCDCWSLTSLRGFSSPGLKVLELSGCSKLESLGDIGTSLERLVLRNCKMLTSLPDLRNLPLLEVVDLSVCDKLEDLGDLGPLRALRRLYLRECGSLTRLGDLDCPRLEVLNLAGCSKLESLGDCGALRSLHTLNLSNCKSLISLPDRGQFPVLKLLVVEGSNLLGALGNCWSGR